MRDQKMKNKQMRGDLPYDCEEDEDENTALKPDFGSFVRNLTF